LLVIGYWLVAAELANKQQQTTNNQQQKPLIKESVIPADRPYAEDLVLF
jgi:hypothetical protein